MALSGFYAIEHVLFGRWCFVLGTGYQNPENQESYVSEKFHAAKIRKKTKKLQNIETFVYFCRMERKIITFGDHFKSFIDSVDEGVRRKIDYILDMLKRKSIENQGGIL